MSQDIGVVDLFAGPGGLGEGFSALRIKGRQPFKIGVSVEREAAAHRTLTLRAFLRECGLREGRLPKEFIEFHAGRSTEPNWKMVDEGAWKLANHEALCLELGSVAALEPMESSIRRIRRQYDETVLIGGPPCQAYSLVGRARARGKKGYVPAQDERHFLFREYIRVLDKLRPAAFIMENVKGMLSSTIESRLVFEMLMEDLSTVGEKRGRFYELFAIRAGENDAFLKPPKQPSDFVVRAEEFGVPQRRHRVIIVGIRSDIATQAANAKIAIAQKKATVHDVLGNLGRLRSGLTSGDDPRTWLALMKGAARRLSALQKGTDSEDLRVAFRTLSAEFKDEKSLPRVSSTLPRRYGKSNDPLSVWLERPQLAAVAQHESRRHMETDLERYLFASVFAGEREFSPKASDFPRELAPKHQNWNSGIFADRFRVQLKNEASTTVTSHISKDGHYFIHPDPLQCRSLTVREAARLQTFPDDYLFMGNRTQQYVQVGNAVPPYLARQIAELVWTAIG